jgi:hypothetical protein
MNLYDMLAEPEKEFHDALVGIAKKHGPIDQNHSGIWVGYVPAEENEVAEIGVMCGNCSMYMGDGGCMILSYKVQGGALCRLAAIPDMLVQPEIDEVVKQSPCWDGYVQRGMKPGKDGQMVPNCVPAKTKKYEGCSCPECLEEDITCSECDNCNPALTKSGNTYTPNAGMKAAARRALKWKEEGKATGAGTPVGWGRASDIVAGRSMSLDTVKRMYSFFSRHEVDKKGKDWNNASSPSNGKIMWEAWGGDAGFAWSRAIVNAQETKKVWQDSPFSR